MQFERLGYFCVDSKDSTEGKPVFNRTVSLRDSWAKIAKKQKAEAPKKKQQPKKAATKNEPDEITIDDFFKVDLRVGVIKEAGFIEGADRLLKLMVDIGEEKPRQIFSGIREFYGEPEKMVGMQVIVVANLKPRKMKFGVSEGMVIGGGNKKMFRVATFDGELKPGNKVS